MQGDNLRLALKPEDDYGRVDFDDEESSTVATLYIQKLEDGSYALRGHTNVPLKIEIQGDPSEPQPHPADKVSYAPCITGKVEIGNGTSEFMLPLLDNSMGWTQWGAHNSVLGARVDLMEKLADAAREWALENMEEDDDDG